ncbi:2-oxo acid dehydrogenase subunit E2 [Chlamydiales bacterium]|nr:2-oxo acid dehydrogenase subunit E2 [Chlamydiales bacterium]
MGHKVTVNLPDIGEGVVEGEVVEWFKEVGDSVEQDEPVVVVMTDKATVELPSPNPGFLTRRYFEVGGIALLDQPLYEIETLEEVSEVPKVKEEAVKVEKEIESLKKEAKKVLATPAVRALAKQLGVDLSEISPNGGQVTAEDVRKFVAKSQGASESKGLLQNFSDDIEEPLAGIKGLMAETMKNSNQMIPHFSFFERLDVTNLKLIKGEMKKRFSDKEINVTYMPFFIRALSLALKEIPYANASIDMDAKKIVLHQRHNIGVAMDTPSGLIVPVLKGVEKMNLDQIIEAFDQLKIKARTGKLTSDDMKEGTISMTNFGTLGGIAGTPIILYPQVAIVGLGKIEPQAVVVDGKIEIRERQMICWSFDHRIIDGAIAAQLSSKYIALLQNPEML